MTLVGIVLTYHKQSDLFQNYQPPYAISPAIVSNTLILSASRITSGNGTAGYTFCIFCFNLSTDSSSNVRDFDGLGSNSVG